MGKEIIVIIIVSFLLSYYLFGVSESFGLTRSQVVNNAISFATVNWQCIMPNEDYDFRTKVDYTGESYLWGGNDSIDKFKNKIADGSQPRSEAGIDCSAFVSRCWQISRQNTDTLLNFGLQISREQLKPGDVLDSPKATGVGHVVLVNNYSAAQIKIYHAKGRGNPNPGVSGYPGQTVVCETAGSWLEDSSYVPMSPFPQFSNLTPLNGDTVNSNCPTFGATVQSGSDVSLVKFIIDGNPNVATLRQNPDKKTITATYTPIIPLSNGQHTVYIYAKNSLDFEEDNSDNPHQFIISSTKLEIESWDFQRQLDGSFIKDNKLNNSAFGIEFTGNYLNSGKAESNLPELSWCGKEFTVNTGLLPIRNLSKTMNFKVVNGGGGRGYMFSGGPDDGKLSSTDGTVTRWVYINFSFYDAGKRPIINGTKGGVSKTIYGYNEPEYVSLLPYTSVPGTGLGGYGLPPKPPIIKNNPNFKIGNGLKTSQIQLNDLMNEAGIKSAQDVKYVSIQLGSHVYNESYIANKLGKSEDVWVALDMEGIDWGLNGNKTQK